MLYKGNRRSIQAIRRIKDLLGDAVSVIVFLLRDEFTTNESSPLTTPRTCEPGPGTLTIVDTNNRISIVGQQLVINGAVVINDGVITQQWARVSGRVYMFCLDNRTTVSVNMRQGWDVNGLAASAVDHGMDMLNATTMRIKAGVAVIDNITLGAGVWQFALVLRSSGAFFIVKVGSGNYVLHWIYDSPATNQFAKLFLSTDTFNFSEDTWSISDMPEPWNIDYGIATERLSGNRSPGDTFIHEADCLIQFDVDTLPGAGQVELWFRKQDNSNYWSVTVDSAGNLDLDEVVATVATQRGTSAGVVNNGDRILIIADGNRIKIYEQNTLRINYGSANNFQTETDGELETEGTGGAISDIVSWPRNISGDALKRLEERE